MWLFAQSTGLLFHDADQIGTGYSGAPEARNDYTKQGVHNFGPIPRGLYTIGDPTDTPTHGPYVLPLEPDPENEMFGRSGFLIHGDAIEHPGCASHGCIIMPRAVRERVHASGDRRLQVI